MTFRLWRCLFFFSSDADLKIFKLCHEAGNACILGAFGPATHPLDPLDLCRRKLLHLFCICLDTWGYALFLFWKKCFCETHYCTRGRALDKELILIKSVLIDQMFVLVFSIQKQIMISSIAIDSLSLACLIHSRSKEWQALKYLVLFFDYWLHRANKTHC